VYILLIIISISYSPVNTLHSLYIKPATIELPLIIFMMHSFPLFFWKESKPSYILFNSYATY